LKPLAARLLAQARIRGFSRVLLFALAALAGCSSIETPAGATVTRTGETSNFRIEVSAPAAVNAGDLLKVNATVTYIGDEPLVVHHGEPIVRFHFTGSDESRGYTDIGYATEFRQGQTIEVEDTFEATKKGKRRLEIAVEEEVRVELEPIEIRVE